MKDSSQISSSRLIQPASSALWCVSLKPVFDRVMAVILFVLLSPFLLVGIVLVKVSSPGPIFFRQQRGGLHGRPFWLVKFRTMRGDRKPDPKELVPLDHPEITAIGKLLRRLKIDEFPQLWNVLKGEMSLVGPRPTLLDQVAAYDEFRRQRLLVKPGLTGLAQVYSSAAASWEERILYDIAYVRRCSLLLDVRIILRTMVVVFVGEERTRMPFQMSPFAHFVDAPTGFFP